VRDAIEILILKIRAKAKGGVDNATSASDRRKSAEKTKMEYPESPVTLGMQDERGRRGV